MLPDGHLSLPEEIFEKLGLTINSTVEVTLKLDRKRERAKKAFGAWSERNDIKDGAGYVSGIREEWDKRYKRICND